MIETFDLIRYLQDKGIEYQTEGKNVTEGWVEVNCPFCSDPSYHLGISPSKKLSCWICGTKGAVTKYIQEIEKCSHGFAQKIIEKYQDRELSHQNIKEREPASFVKLPKSAKPLQKIHQEYLIKRNFDPDFLEKKYDLLGCGELGDFKFRIIIPVFLNNKLITYVGRDVTETQKIKYKNLSIEKSILPTKSVVYNLDSVRDKVIIVEGVTDVWRLGDGAVATFGTEYTKKQLTLFAGIKRAFVFFDNDALDKADRLAYDLTTLIKSVEVVRFDTTDKMDPADLDQKTADGLKKELFF